MSKTNAYTAEGMRARYWELQAQEEALRVELDPKQEARDQHVNTARETELAMNAEIEALNSKISPIAAERALLARALGGRTGIDADTPYDAALADAQRAEAEADAPTVN